MANSPKTILFLGATGGCGLSALRRSLAAGHTCIALCRTPAKLTAKLEDSAVASSPNLHIQAGNAHDVAALSRSLVSPHDPTRLVDLVVSSIGGAFDWHQMGRDDPYVCEKGIRALFEALAACRAKGLTGNPPIVAVSTTGVNGVSRDTPLAIVPLYKAVLGAAGRDKRVMEDLLFASAEPFTVVRASMLTDGPESTTRPIRAGMEDPVAKKVEKKALGYTISREDVGKWIFEHLVDAPAGDRTWVRKVATITY